MKRILMIATGGTIASQSSAAGLKPLISSDKLLSYVPDVRRFCHADTLQLLNIASTNMQPCHWLKIASAIRNRYDAYDGFVICHGTDTMAYTAAALSYLIQNSSMTMPMALLLFLTERSLPELAEKKSGPKATMHFPALITPILLPFRTSV